MSEVKDMKSYVSQVLKASLSKKYFKVCFELNFNNFQERKNCVKSKLLSTTFSPLGLRF
jgi:hypothetical protein